MTIKDVRTKLKNEVDVFDKNRQFDPVVSKVFIALEERLELIEKELRRAVADYMQSEGCSCCQNVEAHKRHASILAHLLDVPMYEDGYGYNFEQFKTRN